MPKWYDNENQGTLKGQCTQLLFKTAVLQKMLSLNCMPINIVNLTMYMVMWMVQSTVLPIIKIWEHDPILRGMNFAENSNWTPSTYTQT